MHYDGGKGAIKLFQCIGVSFQNGTEFIILKALEIQRSNFNDN